MVDEGLFLKNFNNLGLAEPILRAVSAEGYTVPTPIQVQAIPAMLSGRDLIGIAQTGTGKTAAFVLPMLQHINGQRNKPKPKSCGALILTPTRELALQIVENIRTYGRYMKVSVAIVVGGVKPGPQIRALVPGVDIVVATPGRLMDHMNTDVIRLDQTTAVVLDEADQMLDLGFMPAIRKILGNLPIKRQTVLMSATMPKQIRSLARQFQREAIEIAVASMSRPIELITQSVVFTDAGVKRDVLVNILSRQDVERTIVFTRTKRGAEKVKKYLQAAGLNADAIHGDKNQTQRNRSLGAFRSGHTAILVATDVAARGIDVDGVSHVVNFELPNVPEAYIHRIGRTGRAGRGGVAISMCDRTERSALHDIERLIGSRLAIEPVPAKYCTQEYRSESDGSFETEVPTVSNGVSSGKTKPRSKNFRGSRSRNSKAGRQAARPSHVKLREGRQDVPSVDRTPMLGNVESVGTMSPATT